MPKYTRRDIQYIIMNYHWIVQELDRLAALLNTVESVGVASYSDEPRSFTGAISRRVEGEVQRRDKKRNRLKEFADRVNFIAIHSPAVTDEKERVVLDCLLDGMGTRAISKHLNIHHSTVYEMRDRIVDHLYHDSEAMNQPDTSDTFV